MPDAPPILPTMPEHRLVTEACPPPPRDKFEASGVHRERDDGHE